MSRKYLKRCYLRWLPRRLHGYYHHRRLGPGAWRASKYLAAPCCITQADLDWVRKVAAEMDIS